MRISKSIQGTTACEKGGIAVYASPEMHTCRI